MMCEQCGQEPANVHMTKIVDNRKLEAHLCQDCARKYSDFHSELDFSNLFASMVDQPKQWGTVSRKAVQCPTCHLELADVRRLGQLGCSDCYSTFQKELTPLLRRMHGTTKHVGKVPASSHGKVQVERQVQSLRKRLQQAVEAEDYELAAEVRDQIRSLEKEG